MRSKSQFPCSVTLLVAALGLLRSHGTSAEKVLLVPAPFADSHWFALAKIGQALVDRGHVVSVVVAEDIVDKRRSESPDFHFETFQDQGSGARIKELQNKDLSVAGELSAQQFLRIGIAMSTEMTAHCDLLLGDGSLLARLKEGHYSVVISDPLFPCGAIIAAYPGVRLPHIAVLRVDFWSLDIKATGVPLPMSYVPFFGIDLTDRMTFLQRVQNVLLYTLVPMGSCVAVASIFDGLSRKYLGEEETIQSVTARTDLWMYQTDHLLNTPRPSMPNMVQVGGLNARAARPLSEELEAFVQSSGEDGVVVVSFGSIVKTMTVEKIDVFAAALSRLRQKVVWRYEGEKPAGLGNNTKLMKWLPQNDILGHSKTRVFITHAGSNGMYEALHHAVPMVCLPFFGDQPGNAALVEAMGLGVKLDFSTITMDQLYEAVIHVLTNNSYQETATRLSRLYHDQPQSPMERAVWWIEHVIRHGGLPHLRARAVGLPWYQYYLLDVAAFLLVVCSTVLMTVWCSCSIMCRKACSKSGGKLKSQ